jgi:hypothetical protein
MGFKSAFKGLTQPEYICIALGIQHATRMRNCVPSVACPALQYFSTLSHIHHDFPHKKLLDIK